MTADIAQGVIVGAFGGARLELAEVCEWLAIAILNWYPPHAGPLS